MTEPRSSKLSPQAEDELRTALQRTAPEWMTGDQAEAERALREAVIGVARAFGFEAAVSILAAARGALDDE